MSFEELRRTNFVKDFVKFYSMDKFNLQNIIVEAEKFKPHIINTHKATRLVFETYDGAFI
jgi:hypothetical protein